jgi:hypothetical protein
VSLSAFQCSCRSASSHKSQPYPPFAPQPTVACHLGHQITDSLLLALKACFCLISPGFSWSPYSLDPMTTGVGVGGSCSQAISWLLSSYNLLLSPYGHTLTYLISSEAAIVFILFYFLILIYLVRLGFDLRASCFVKQAFYCLSHTSSPCYCLLTNSDSLICCLASVFPCQKVGSLWRRVLACLVLLCPSPPPPPGPTQNGSACLLGG